MARGIPNGWSCVVIAGAAVAALSTSLGGEQTRGGHRLTSASLVTEKLVQNINKTFTSTSQLWGQINLSPSVPHPSPVLASTPGLPKGFSWIQPLVLQLALLPLVE
ncbi:hypothetical protein KIL84_006817 [Mauremys mutica]|uniref:Uncharacterized protein n=1 Tax=Mauremys mutica TaxID=74926 RepID=A0A9D3WZX7_9SAUR|nr:hypothetical protein KIL84_006817 [Mauremys mutica]